MEVYFPTDKSKTPQVPDVPRGLPFGHLGIIALGEVDLERQQILRRQGEDPLGGEELELAIARADLLEQRRRQTVGHGQRASFFAFSAWTVSRSITRSRTSPAFAFSSMG